MKLWEKNYSLDKLIEDFTVGNDYILDQKLVKYDCVASMAHAKMLGKIDLLTSDEVDSLVLELQNIIQLSEKNHFPILKEQEDCHTAIEQHLVKKLGDLGKKIHTARSRNDQVLTALRLYYKEGIKNCQNLAEQFITVLQKFVKKYGHIEYPGFTHTRKAMPSSFEMWGNAFVDSMKDNLKLLETSFELIDQSPLGTAAGYGVSLAIDREFTAKEMNFSKIQDNPIYTQNSRGKFDSTILHTLTQIMFDINKISSDLIFFSLDEFGFVELPVEFCTGSSIMPHKKNPDVLELLRAKYHVVLSHEIQVKNISANLISGYNRDLQLTKEAVFNSFDITEGALKVISLVIEKMKVNEQRCNRGKTDEIYAVNKVYELVKKGIPFREAYGRIAEDYS
jgi:argininosuccinate lyase